MIDRRTQSQERAVFAKIVEENSALREALASAEREMRGFRWQSIFMLDLTRHAKLLGRVSVLKAALAKLDPEHELLSRPDF